MGLSQATKCFVLLLAPLLTWGLYSSRSDVVQLTDDTFKDKVLKSDSVWMIEFYAPWCGHCRNLVADWDKAATTLKGVVNVGAVDATVSQKLAQKYQVQGFPTIKVFGADKRSPTDYQGARSADAIVGAGMQAAQKMVKDRMSGGRSSSSSSSKKPSGGGGSGSGSRSRGDVVTLTEDNFEELVMKSTDQWLVEFYAPWCGHCKNLEPEWAAAATKLKGSVKLGAVDATVHTGLAGQYGVRGYPTIKLFPAGPNKRAVDYNGPREAAGIVDYALAELDKAGIPPEVKQLTSQSVLDETCTGSVVCLLAALPHIVDSGKSGRNGYLDTLMEAAKKLRRSPVRIMWMEGGSQPAAESALGLTFGFPAVAAVSLSKGVYATQKGSFTADGINGFFISLTAGKEATVPLAGGKLKIDNVQPWDGEDAQVVEEEEFSLDDIMGEEL